VEVIKKHEIDAGEKDEAGFYDYFYEFDDYSFVFDGVTFFARSYSDTPEEVSFRAVIVNEKMEILETHHIKSENFIESVEYLKSEGKNNIRFLTGNGYENFSI